MPPPPPIPPPSPPFRGSLLPSGVELFSSGLDLHGLAVVLVDDGVASLEELRISSNMCFLRLVQLSLQLRNVSLLLQI